MPSATEQTAANEAATRANKLIERPPILIYPGDLDRIVTWGIKQSTDGDSAVTIRRLLDALEVREQALLFYANRNNQHGVGVSAVYNDHGDRARRAVGECERCEGRGFVKTGVKIMDQDGPYDETTICPGCYGSGCSGTRYGA